MADEKGSFDIATVRIFPFSIKHLFVEFNVIVVYGVVKCDGNHLRNIFGRKIAGDGSAIFRTEAVGENADSGVARRCPVRVIINIWNF